MTTCGKNNLYKKGLKKSCLRKKDWTIRTLHRKWPIIEWPQQNGFKKLV